MLENQVRDAYGMGADSDSDGGYTGHVVRGGDSSDEGDRRRRAAAAYMEDDDDF